MKIFGIASPMPQTRHELEVRKNCDGFTTLLAEAPRHNFFFLDLHQNEDAGSPWIADRIFGQNET